MLADLNEQTLECPDILSFITSLPIGRCAMVGSKR